MATQFLCAQGHLWEDLFETPSLLDGELRCPHCGAVSTAQLPSATACVSAFKDSSPLLPEVAVPPTEVGPNQDPDQLPRTEVRPALAGLTLILPGPEDDSDDPIVPSHLLTRHGSHTHQDALGSARKRKPTLPDVPGYDLLDELGRGGMGVVYKARQMGLNRVVALKMILAGSHADEADRLRFRTEAEAIARLQHPNIVQIFEVGEHKGCAYFSLEFVDGGCLADRLRGKPAGVVDSARTIEALARAMHFAHQQDVVHRDLKPGNVLLASDGTPKVTDFGLAKTLDRDLNQTRSGMAVGTPAYMSPEQAAGLQNVGPPTDTYALGVMLYQMVTGKLPFVGDTPMEVMCKVTQEEPPRPSRWVPKLARDLETIVLKCLEKAPSRRYESALALAEDLRRFLDHEPILARPVGRLERAARCVRRHKLQAGVLAVVMAAALAVTATSAVWARAEQGRKGQDRAEAEAALAEIEKQAGDRHWKDVDLLTSSLLQRVENKSHLADLAGPVQQWAALAQRHRQARETVEAFESARDEALFLATLASGMGTPAHLAATRAKIHSALARVGATDTRLPASDDRFSAEQQAAIQHGCYELLLVLAETAAHRLPGQTPEQVTKNALAALAILDTANGLGVQTHAYYLRRARYHDLAGQGQQADQLRSLAHSHPPTRALDHYLVGSEHYRRGEIADAEKAFDAAVRLQPDHFWATYFLGLCHVCQGQLIAARDNLTSCLWRRPGVVWIYLLRGYVQGQLHCFDEAEADFKAALDKLDSNDRGARYVLLNNWAVTHQGRGRFREAEGLLRQAVALAPQHYQAHVTLSQVLSGQGGARRAEALAALERGIACAERQRAAKEVGSATLTLLYRMRFRLHVGNDNAAALTDLNALIGLLDEKARANAQRDRGHLLSRAGKLDEALQAYTAAIQAAPDRPEVYRWQGEVLLRLKRYTGAVAAFDSYLRLGGKPELSVYRGRAIAHVQLDAHEQAVHDVTHALALIPKPGKSDAELLVLRGQRYLVLKAWALAAKDFDAALALDDGKAAAFQGRGLARLQQGQIGEAAADAEACVRAAGQDWRDLYGACALLAQVAGQVEPPAGAAPGSFEARKAQRLREGYQDRAVALLRQVIASQPAGERQGFWKDTVQREPALRPLSPHEGFIRLDRTFRR